MKRKMKQRLAIWITGVLLIGLLPMQNVAASQSGNTSQAEAEGLAQTDYGLQNPRKDNGITTWDSIYFGNYWQEDTNGDGKVDKNDNKTSIRWRVLSVEGEDAFLLADKNLDCQSYNSQNWQITWENSTMRSWLNGYGAEENKVGMNYSGDGFLNNAFTEAERQVIKTTNVVNNDNPDYATTGGNDTSDRIYLLSFDELTNPAYGFVSSTDSTDTRKAENTAYTAGGGEIQGDMQGVGRSDYWWSRSPGRNSSAAVIVHADGKISDIYNVNYTMVAVRPVLHLDLATLPGSWSYAGIVTAGKPIATPTPTQKPTPTLTPTPTPTPTQSSTATPTSAAATPAPATTTPDLTLLSEIKEVSLEGIVKFVIPQKMAVPANIEKITAILPGQVTITGENGQSAIMPVEGAWVYDTEKNCWRNSVDAARLPSGFTDRAGVLSDISIGCEVGDNQGLVFEMCGTSSNEINHNQTDGTEGRITIRRNPTSVIDTVILYQITKRNDTYLSESRYSTGASEGVTEDTKNHAFVIHTTYSLADTGDYVAVGYAQRDRKTAYLSDTVVPLQVTGKKEDSGIGNIVGDSTEDSDGKDSDLKKGNINEEKKQDTGKKAIIPKVGKIKKYKVRVKKKGAVLTWKKSSKVSGYQVQISKKKSFKGAKKISVKKSKTRYKISKLKPGKKYYVRIRAYKVYKTQNGKKKKAYGKWTRKRIKVPI